MEVIDRLHDAFLEIDARLPAQNFAGASNVGLTHFRIVHRQRFVLDLRFRPGDPDDLFGELLDRHLARVPDIDRLVEIAREPERATSTIL